MRWWVWLLVVDGHGRGPTRGSGAPGSSGCGRAGAVSWFRWLAGVSGSARIVRRTGSVTGYPTEKNAWMPRSRRARMWCRNALAAPALSVRMSRSVPWRWGSGNWARAASRTVMWSAAVLAPALPILSSPARASPVLSRTRPDSSRPRPVKPVPLPGSRAAWSQLPSVPRRRPQDRRCRCPTPRSARSARSRPPGSPSPGCGHVAPRSRPSGSRSSRSPSRTPRSPRPPLP